MALAIAVAGAGIGGLTAALALARAGHQVTVLERRTGFSEIGAGLQISPNASRVLGELGLLPALRRSATVPRAVEIRSLSSGRGIAEVALTPFLADRHGAPYLVCRRADLQMALLDAVRSTTGVRLLLGRTVRETAAAGDGVALTVEREGGARDRIEVDAVVGADGVGSRVRRALDGRTPRYHGSAAWRATAPIEAVPELARQGAVGLWLGPRRHVVHYPVAGGRTLNIVAVEPRREPVRGWSGTANPSELAEAFHDAADPLAGILRAGEGWQLWSLYDLKPGALAQGRVALLGDAAHPVLPFLAQGAALAIEDAAVLARALRDCPGEAVLAALQAYARERGPRVRRVQAEAQRNGRIYHAGFPVAQARDLVMARAGPERLATRLDWLYGWRPRN